MKHAAFSARTTLVLIALLFGVLAPTSALSAQEKAAEEKSEAKKDSEKADDEEEDEDEFFAIVGGDVHTVTRGSCAAPPCWPRTARSTTSAMTSTSPRRLTSSTPAVCASTRVWSPAPRRRSSGVSRRSRTPTCSR